MIREDDPVMDEAERTALLKHLLGMRSYFAERAPAIAQWANDRLIDLSDERSAIQASIREDLDLLEFRFEAFERWVNEGVGDEPPPAA